ncbi:hypothetical protein A3860_37605 [Niastella vici]|uniref:Carboxypeptidase regulatory-like domain-containing protein n=1 Tax=Niastella vici TaxID=1703345 RepID=A0A1V9FMA5_9BACT|nr:carboxypeptidase-like regulatory domain-containing protein [Niastella vici]OQP59468.1 hypothetical protein A3860_37605 [Niastella vici]
MKKILQLGFTAVTAAGLIIISCQKTNNDNPTNPNIPVEYVTASITGRVVDNSNQPVNGALVNAGTASTTTDLNGNFSFSNVSLAKNAGFVKVIKDGFFEGSRTILVNAGVVNYVSMQLIKKTVSGTVSGSSGGNVTVTGGGSVVFTGNSFVNTGGNNAYTGTVSVSTWFLNPTASNFSEIMPGTLRGINAGNEETGLQSFGMMAVELTGAGGEKLQLAAGKTATLTFPIPAALQGQAPATIPLWTFNDTTGLWKEEGIATKQGANYVGTVSHFSFWNCDYPYSLCDFKIICKDQNGKPFYPCRVELKTTGDSISRYGYGYTDATGYAGGKIPKGKTLQLKLYSQCNTVIYTQDIGPFTATADLGTITVNFTGTSPVMVSGSAVNCSGGPVTNGFVDISIDEAHNRVAITNGSFSMAVNRCSDAPTTAAITAYDLGTNQGGNATTVAVNSATVNAGQLSACGNSLVQFLNYTLKDTNVSYIPPADSLQLLSNINNNFALYAYRKATNDYEKVYLSFNATGTGTVPINYVYILKNNRQYVQASTLNMNITEFGVAGTGYISGNFSGNLKDSSSNVILPASMSFRVKRKQ